MIDLRMKLKAINFIFIFSIDEIILLFDKDVIEKSFGILLILSP